MLKRKSSFNNKENQSPGSPLKRQKENQILSNKTNSLANTSSHEATSEKQSNELAKPEPVEISDKQPKETKTKTSENQQAHNVTATQLQEWNANDAIKMIKIINSSLKKTKSSGQYAFDGEATELPPLLGLEIKNYGPVSLPLYEEQAEKLIKVCEQAPFGRNEKTLLDRNVRDSYQLDPSHVKIKNPTWNAKLKELVARVAKGLGCLSEIEAKLYKLLLYKKGGHFLRHRDTEKDPFMFGTLVIQLPSKYTGGELIVYHNTNGTKKCIDFGHKGGKNEYSIFFGAHYADLEHELLEVKSGYRLVLVYSLCWRHGTDSFINPNSLTDTIHHCIRFLNSNESKTFVLAMMLDHQYTPSSLQKSGIKSFKGIDKDRYNLLKSVDDQLDDQEKLSFYLCHSNLVISYTGYADDEEFMSDSDWEEEKRQTIITEWYNIDGTRAFENSCVQLKNLTSILNPSHETMYNDLMNDKDWIDYKKKEYDIEFTGNEGASKHARYSRYLLLFFPRRFEFQLLTSLNCDCALTWLLAHKSAMGREELAQKVGMLLNKFRDFHKIKTIYARKENAHNHHHNRQSNEDVDVDDQAMDDKLPEDCILRTVDQYSEDYEPYDDRPDIERKSMGQLAEIIIELEDVDLIKQFLRYVVNEQHSFYRDEIPLASIIVKFGFKTLKKELECSFKPSCSSFADNYNLALELYKMGANEEAKHVLNGWILPKFDKSSLRSFKMFNITSEKDIRRFYNYDDKYFKLAKLFLLSHTNQSYMNTLIDYIVKELHNGFIKYFVEDFLNEPNLLIENKCKSIVDVILTRKFIVENRLKLKNEFSWCMPNASLPGRFAEIENFLKSEKQTELFDKIFTNLQEAKRFAAKYQGLKDGYSTEIKATMFRTKCIIEVIKTRHLYDQQAAVFTGYEKELSRINELVEKLK